jgi:hypothetical protein
MPIPNDAIHLPKVTAVVVTLTPRIMELFHKDGPLTAEEWAELELYEAMQKEEFNEFHEG